MISYFIKWYFVTNHNRLFSVMQFNVINLIYWGTELMIHHFMEVRPEINPTINAH